GWTKRSLIEIGCGKADFLKMLCELGRNEGIGFDPSIESVDWQSIGDKGGKIKLVRGYFGKDKKGIPGDHLICQHVLEHIENPAAFLSDIVDSRSGYTSHIVYFEVPNALYTLRDFGVWDIIYEHCSYFSPASMQYLFKRFGYSVETCEEVYGNQFLSLYAGSDGKGLEASGEDTAELIELVDQFSQTFKEKTARWKDVLAPARAGEKKVVVWGAGSKGITFLNMITGGKGIDFIIDQNPAKIGKYVAGTGQQIESPAFLSSYQPDQVIIMNPLYQKEISRNLKKMGLTPEIFVA
ncbi:MAG: class I SAM-dependent methyltransferase, partial [Verrucomicrobia bacterium]|nr:class I SAM-dependent methyltransferase [Verrucomicrobiota bacterium]